MINFPIKKFDLKSVKNYTNSKEAVDYVKNFHLESPTKYKTLQNFLDSRNKNTNKLSITHLIRNIELKSLDKKIAKSNKTQNIQKTRYESSYTFNQRNEPFCDFEDYIADIKYAVYRHKAGNCSEQALMTADYLRNIKNSKKVALISFNILKKGLSESKDHVFTVVGLKRSANLQDPSTWGKHVFIADPWANIVSPAEQGIKKLKKLFCYNPKNGEKIVFDDYAKTASKTFNLNPNTPFSWNYYKASKKRS